MHMKNLTLNPQQPSYSHQFAVCYCASIASFYNNHDLVELICFLAVLITEFNPNLDGGGDFAYIISRNNKVSTSDVVPPFESS